MQAELREALGEDLEQIIRLHDRELDAATLAALQAGAFPSGLALAPDGEMGRAAWQNMAAALVAPGSLDELAADYAAIYLNNSFGASPYESVWLSDEHLACDRPMFELREIYAAAGLQAADWRRRFDDHLVLQLHYLRHALADAAVPAAPLAGFIDEHIGFWFPDFARRVALKCDTPFYAALVELTHVWLLHLRELLDDIHDLPIPGRDEISRRIHRKLALDKAEIAPIKFVPGGQGPSW